MTWFKVDDHFWGHPKRLACSLTEIGLWVTAGSWAAQQKMDGRIPKHVLSILGGRPRDAAGLVRAGLWHETNDGWVFHGWDDFQPTKQQLDEKREEDARRKQEWRDKRAAQKAEEQRRRAAESGSVTAVSQWDNNETPSDVPAPVPVVSHPTRPEPDPTRPDPNPSSLREDEHNQGQVLKTSGRLTSTEFETWWDAYPRKVAKKAARDKYVAARKEASAEELLAGAMRYRDDPTRGATCHPATWLHQGRWADEEPANTNEGAMLALVKPARLRASTTDANVSQTLALARQLREQQDQLFLPASGDNQ